MLNAQVHILGSLAHIRVGTVALVNAVVAVLSALQHVCLLASQALAVVSMYSLLIGLVHVLLLAHEELLAFCVRARTLLYQMICARAVLEKICAWLFYSKVRFERMCSVEIIL
jgi:hypothetical protein